MSGEIGSGTGRTPLEREAERAYDHETPAGGAHGQGTDILAFRDLLAPGGHRREASTGSAGNSHHSDDNRRPQVPDFSLAAGGGSDIVAAGSGLGDGGPIEQGSDINRPTPFSGERTERRIGVNNSDVDVDANRAYFHASANSGTLTSRFANGNVRVETNNGTLRSELNRKTTVVGTNHGEMSVRANKGRIDLGTNNSDYGTTEGAHRASEQIGKNAGEVSIQRSASYNHVDRNDGHIQVGSLGAPHRDSISAVEAQEPVEGRAYVGGIRHRSGRASEDTIASAEGRPGRAHVAHVSPRASIASQGAIEAQSGREARPGIPGTTADEEEHVPGLLKGGKLHIRDQNGFVDHVTVDKNGKPTVKTYEPTPGVPLELDHKGEVRPKTGETMWEKVGANGIRAANVLGTFTGPAGLAIAAAGAYHTYHTPSGGGSASPATSSVGRDSGLSSPTTVLAHAHAFPAAQVTPAETSSTTVGSGSGDVSEYLRQAFGEPHPSTFVTVPSEQPSPAPSRAGATPVGLEETSSSAPDPGISGGKDALDLDDKF